MWCCTIVLQPDNCLGVTDPYHKHQKRMLISTELYSWQLSEWRSLLWKINYETSGLQQLTLLAPAWTEHGNIFNIYPIIKWITMFYSIKHFSSTQFTTSWLPTWPVEYLKEKSACRWSSFSCDTASTVCCWLSLSADGIYK
jgi:hypothetical protein